MAVRRAVGAAVRTGRRWRRSSRRLALRVDPTPAIVARLFPGRPVSGVLVGVYRTSGVAAMERLVTEAMALGLSPRLWALDAPAASLAHVTAGGGPGTRQELLNRLLGDAAATPGGTGEWTVVADDDAVLAPGALGVLLEVARVAELDLAQPGHGPSSLLSHDFLLAKAGIVCRRTGFVEIGPLVAWRASAGKHLLPLDESLGMGWGQDYLWARAIADAGVRAGVVDAVRVVHTRPQGTQYHYGEARAIAATARERARWTTYGEPMHNLAVWRVTRRRPPWT